MFQRLKQFFLGNLINPHAAPPPVESRPSAEAIAAKQAPARKFPPIKIVAVDIDGTLLSSNNQLSPNVIKAVHEATRRGVYVVLITARPPHDVRGIYQALNLSTYQVNYNGALICTGTDFQVLHHRRLKTKLAYNIIQIARQISPGIQLRVDSLYKWYTDRATPPPKNPTKLQPPEKVCAIEEIVENPITRLTFLAKAEHIQKVRLEVRERYAQYILMPHTDPRVLQITHANAQKSVALEWITGQYNVARENVMAIGDAPNDIDMIRWAGLGVAMGNAWIEVMEEADVTVASNNKDGVAEAIYKYVLK